jgi:hypothetical protein
MSMCLFVEGKEGAFVEGSRSPGLPGREDQEESRRSVYITYSVFFFLNQQRSFFFQFFMAVLVS